MAKRKADRVAEIDADAIDDALRLRRVGVAVDHLFLHQDRAFDRCDHGRKFQQHAVAHGLDETPAESANDWRRRLAPFANRLRRARFVLAHEPGITDDVGGEDRRKLPGLAHRAPLGQPN
jgi:hypothetical protein